MTPAHVSAWRLPSEAPTIPPGRRAINVIVWAPGLDGDPPSVSIWEYAGPAQWYGAAPLAWQPLPDPPKPGEVSGG